MINRASILFVLVALLAACNKEKERGETYSVSGYLTPNVYKLDSVLRNTEIEIWIDMSNKNLGNSSKYIRITTDSLGFFQFSYKNDDYYEENERTRSRVEVIGIKLYEDDGIDYTIDTEPYQFIPVECNLEEVNIVPGDTGWVMLANICADR